MPSHLDVAQDLVQLTRDLVDMASPSGEERVIADAVEGALRGCPHLDVNRDGNAIVARTKLGRPSRVLIAGHLDTVPPHNNLPSRITGEGTDQEIWGRGTVDMKAGCAVALKLATDIHDPVFDVTWVFYDNEEVAANLNGLGRVMSLSPELLMADVAVLGEPTSARIEGGCNGTLRVDIVASGVRAHSARSWTGVNAVHALAPALETLASFQAEEVEVDGLVFREGLNAVGISGGVASNVIPDQASVTVNYRFAPNKSEQQATEIVRALFPGFEVRVVDSAPGARPGLTHPSLRALVDLVDEAPRAKYGWTDVARFSALGIPALNFGPGDPNLAHADDERVSVSDLLACERILRRWLTGTHE